MMTPLSSAQIKMICIHALIVGLSAIAGYLTSLTTELGTWTPMVVFASSVILKTCQKLLEKPPGIRSLSVDDSWRAASRQD